MKKRSIALLLMLVIALTALLTSCNLVRSGTMKKIKGTYELTDYSLTYEAAYAPESGAVVDYIARDEIKMYLVLDGTNEATVFYESRDCEPIRYKVSVNYTYDQEESDKISYVTYKSGSASDDNKTLMHYEQLAVFASGRDVSLSYTTPNLRLIDGGIRKYSTDYVRFEKVSKKTDNSYVKSINHMLPPEVDMTLYQFDGLLGANSIEKYVYYYIDIDYKTLRADIYYAMAPELAEGEILKESDIIDMVKEDVSVGRIGGDLLTVEEVRIDERSYTSPYRGTLVNSDGLSFSHMSADSEITELIANAKAFYLVHINGESAE